MKYNLTESSPLEYTRKHPLVLFLGALLLALISAAVWHQQSVASDQEDLSEVRINTDARIVTTQPAPEVLEPTSPQTDSTTAPGRSDTGSNKPTRKVEVKVNGQSLEVPENGSAQHHVSSDNGNVQIDIQSHNSSTNVQSHNSTSSNVQVHSNTFSSGN